MAGQRIRCGELGCVIKVDRHLPAAHDATVWAAVRPEKISMTPRAARWARCGESGC